MFQHSFVIADQDRVSQFAMLTKVRRHFKECEIWRDGDGIPWAGVCIDGFWHAICLMGPGWMFDPYACSRKQADLERARQTIDQMTDEELATRASELSAMLILGNNTERLLWTIHSCVVHGRHSVLKISDRLMSITCWGDAGTPPNWRSSISNQLRGLSYLHLAESKGGLRPQLGQDTALLTHFADLRVSSNNKCDDTCLDRDGSKHGHFLFNIGRGFLGVLEQFGRPTSDGGGRTYDFKIRGKASDGPTLSSVGKTGKLISLYLPPLLGDPTKCSTINKDGPKLIRAVSRETTRKPRTKRKDPSEAEEIKGNVITGSTHHKQITCDQLEPGKSYVGFNGNGRRKGLGYGLSTPKGWLKKAGYEVGNIAQFLDDLATIAGPLGLIAVGIHPRTKQCFSLAQLRALVRSKDQRIRKMHLRLYTESDYVSRWNEYFGWPQPPAPASQIDNQIVKLRSAVKERSITQAALAAGIGMDRSFLSKCLSGSKQFPPDKLAVALEWIGVHSDQADSATDNDRSDDSNVTDNPNVAPILPILAAVEHGKASMLEVAIAAHQRGWSVVPQIPGAKSPKVKWKPYQTRQPTIEELTAWFRHWPDAGLALVLGPVSGLLVVDVDGSEAHQVLNDRLVDVGTAPKSISGSQKPDRYHLFYQCPDVPTRAKSTPWHPKLEFRGEGGIVVIPPSMHPSGQRYRWADGRSIDDLAPPALPEAILDAIRPQKVELPVIADPLPGDGYPGSAKTREFLSGKCAEGPGWNDRLFQAACDLAGRGMSRTRAEPLLLAGAKPWNPAELESARRTIASAYAQPRNPAKF